MKFLSRLAINRCQLMALVAIATISCSGPQIIPDDKLEGIITDVLLTEGVRNSGMKIEADGSLDSVDFYSPVLNNYGYSIVDFRYTINTLASRKSNPLEGIMDRVMVTIDHLAQIAQHRYDISRRFDSLAIAAYADTVYRLDSTLIGSLKKFRIKIDSIESGDYRMTMSYSLMEDYRIPQKSIRYYFAKKGDKKPAERATWLTRKDVLTEFNDTFTTTENSDSLIVFFADVTVNRPRTRNEGVVKDTSMVKNIVIVHTPPLQKARTRYYNALLGHKFSAYSDLQKQDEQQHKKDSLPGPIGLSR